MQLGGQRVLVVGLGASGRAAARLAVARGAVVTGVDLRLDVAPIDGVTLELGPHDRRTFLRADLIVVSPGVPGDQVDVIAAEEAGVPVIGELGLAAQHLVGLPMVGITGTNGKSTVTHFVGQLVRAAGLRAFVGGNLGNPLCNAAMDGETYDLAVVEVSSYQLERSGVFAPAIAVVLNLTPDHLTRHGDMRGYAKAKAQIYARQVEGSVALLPEDPRVRGAAEGLGRGVRVRLGDWAGERSADELDDELGVSRVGRTGHVRLPGVTAALDLSGLTVPGSHNLDNAVVAAAIALFVGAPLPAVQAAIGDLVALEHRMQVVVDRRGVLWIDDSKATNVDAARVGVAGLARSAVVLLGGRAKSAGFDSLIPHLRDHRAVVTFGESGEAIATELEDAGQAVVRRGTLAEAVQTAAALARSGDAVLLSPGGSSFDAYDNFECRGRDFRALVEEVTR